MTLRIADKESAAAIAAFLSTIGPHLGWNEGKWLHYYERYPIQRPLSLVQDDENGQIAGHCGVLPVRAGGIAGGLVAHTLIRADRRNLAHIRALLLAVEHHAREAGMRFLCGFPNRTFAAVAVRLMGWSIPGCYGFSDRPRLVPERSSRRYAFEYPPAWYDWKFGEAGPAWIQDYAHDGRVSHQLLKTSDDAPVEARAYGFDAIQCWSPDAVIAFPSENRAQPFMVHRLDRTLPEAIADITNWYAEMGDSDTFEYRRDRARRP